MKLQQTFVHVYGIERQNPNFKILVIMLNKKNFHLGQHEVSAYPASLRS